VQELWIAAAHLLIRPERPVEYASIALYGLFLLVTYVESYGYPFTLSIFADQLARYPSADHLGWRAGDLWRVLFETPGGEGAFDWFHIIAEVLIFEGLIALFLSRKTLEAALASGVPATAGPYHWVRHPLPGALLDHAGDLVQSPAILYLLLFPILNLSLRRSRAPRGARAPGPFRSGLRDLLPADASVPALNGSGVYPSRSGFRYTLGKGGDDFRSPTLNPLPLGGAEVSAVQ
jgi:hypothetical protein